MYIIKSESCDKLLKLSGDGYPNRKVIQKYKNRSQKAQENTVRALASLLGVDDWKDLIERI